MADDYDPTGDVSSIYKTGMGGLTSGLRNLPGDQARSRAIEGQRLQGGLSFLQNWDSNHANIPLMMGAGAMLAPTKTGSFSESLGNAFTAGGGALQHANAAEMDRFEKMQRLQQAQSVLALRPSSDALDLAGKAFTGLGAAKTGAGTVSDFNLYQNPLFKSPTPVPGAGADASDPSATPVVADASPVAPEPSPVAPESPAPTATPAPAPAESKVAMDGPDDPNAPAANMQPVTSAFVRPDAPPPAPARGANAATGPGMGAMLERDQQLLQMYRQNPGAFRGPEGQLAVQAAVKRIQESPQYKAAVKGSEVSAEETAKDPHTLVEEQGDDGRTGRRTRAQVLADVNADPSGATVGSVGGQAKISKYQEDRLAGNAKAEEEMFKGYQPIQQAQQRLDNISKILETYQTGKWADTKANAVAAARSLGINLPDSATANPAAFQKFMKEATAEVMDQVKQMGGRPLVTEIAAFQKALMDPTLQPEANASIVKNLKGALQWRQQYIEDYAKWRQSPQGKNDPNPENFEIAWTKQNPLSKYVTEAGKNVAAKGEPIPTPEKREVGKAYITPKGKFRWMGNGWEKAD